MVLENKDDSFNYDSYSMSKNSSESVQYKWPGFCSVQVYVMYTCSLYIIEIIAQLFTFLRYQEVYKQKLIRK